MQSKEYDELKIQSTFMQWVGSKLITSYIKRKLGKDIFVNIDKLRCMVSDGDDDIIIDAHVTARVPKDYVYKAVKGYLKEEK